MAKRISWDPQARALRSLSEDKLLLSADDADKRR